MWARSIILTRPESAGAKYRGRVGRDMLRPATPGDLEALMALEAECFGDRQFRRDTVAWILDNPDAATIVEDRGGIVGSIMVQFDRDACRILSVAVRPAWRRRGIGGALMEAAERLARGLGSKAVRLEVGTENRAAIQFYKKLGYKIEGLLYGYYRDGEDGYAMHKALGEANA